MLNVREEWREHARTDLAQCQRSCMVGGNASIDEEEVDGSCSNLG